MLKKFCEVEIGDKFFDLITEYTCEKVGEDSAIITGEPRLNGIVLPFGPKDEVTTDA